MDIFILLSTQYISFHIGRNVYFLVCGRIAIKFLRTRTNFPFFWAKMAYEHSLI